MCNDCWHLRQIENIPVKCDLAFMPHLFTGGSRGSRSPKANQGDCVLVSGACLIWNRYSSIIFNTCCLLCIHSCSWRSMFMDCMGYPSSWNYVPLNIFTKYRVVLLLTVMQQSSYPQNNIQMNQQNFDNLWTLASRTENDSTVFYTHKYMQCFFYTWSERCPF